MSGHTIVCGMGDVGYRIVELLNRLGEEVVVVTQGLREERLAESHARGICVIRGDARNERLLFKAGLLSSRAVIVVTDQVSANIEISLAIRRCRPDVAIVVRLLDPELARQLEQALDVRRALDMPSSAASSFAAAALGDAVIASFKIGEIPFVVGRTLVERSVFQHSPDLKALERTQGFQTLLMEREGATCEALPELDIRLELGDRLSFLGRKQDWDRLCGAADGHDSRPRRLGRLRQLGRVARRAFTAWKEEPLGLRLVFLGVCVLIPLTVLLFHFYLKLSIIDAIFYTVRNLHGEIGLSTTLPEIKLYEILLTILGSVTVATLYSMITDYLVASRLKKVQGGQPIPRRGGHVIVAGMGQVGYRILRELQTMGVPVAAIDINANASLLPNVRPIATVITGDARSDEILAQADLPRARAVIAVTGDDSVNLSIGLASKRGNSKARTAVRLSDEQFALKVEREFKIDAALSATQSAAPTFVAAALYPNVAKTVIVKDRLFVLIERQAGSWAGRTPAELRAAEGIRLLRRNGALPIAVEETPLQAEEKILAVLSRTLAPAWSEASASPPV